MLGSTCPLILQVNRLKALREQAILLLTSAMKDAFDRRAACRVGHLDLLRLVTWSPRAPMRSPDVKPPPLEPGVDYYMEEGKLVFTAAYHLKRGYCCNSGCRHCPYKGVEVISVPEIPALGAPGRRKAPRD